MLELKDIFCTRRHGTVSQSILKGVSLSVAKADIIAISGKSGSGKSTLLQIIAGIIQPTSGSVRLYDKEFSSCTADKRAEVRLRSIGIVHQAFRLLPQLTLWQNACLPSQCLGQRRSEYEARIEKLFVRLNITSLKERLPEEVSGGELQRAAIARALSASPGIILADEPTGNLDEDTARETLVLFREIIEEFAVPLILVSHDKEICNDADRHLHLHRGRLQCMRS